ncbi:hypothetical protein RND71_015029 [Anisodus tanguticus]|uniref:Uncharacterized protein n=1 Tax=Anisodus tanguticus TaxID=243964 RepID=A0AAE1VNA8_9SOLA|nr:hypothetical protein RND71_015029 [Anisodus tanguticus]
MIQEVDAVKRQHGKHKNGDVKLFVFGDSYVDTGNWPTSMSSSWKEPYGRFSFWKIFRRPPSFLGIRSPLPYNKKGSSVISDGVNFAYGGTGIFNTFVNQPNMTTQINYFQQLLEEKEQVYNKENMSSSIALVSVAGNDYATFLTNNGNNIEKLNNQTGRPVFFIFDVYSAFMSALDIQQNQPGNSNFENPLKPCCMGTSNEYSCGDKRGNKKKYMLCKNPELSFFWDVIHPSQQGWFAVFSALSLHLVPYFIRKFYEKDFGICTICIVVVESKFQSSTTSGVDYKVLLLREYSSTTSDVEFKVSYFESKFLSLLLRE